MSEKLNPVALEAARHIVVRGKQVRMEGDFPEQVIRIYLASIGEQGAMSSADLLQRRGIALDIIDEALNTFSEWMLDDDYEAGSCLQSIMNRMRERRALIAQEQS